MTSVLSVCALVMVTTAGCTNGRSGQVPATMGQPVAASTHTASDIAALLKEHGLAVGEVRTYDATTDPNHLLGRPAQYTSKVNFHDERFPASSDFDIRGGGSVEVFASDADAERRSTYVETIAKSIAFMNEYGWRKGRVLLRVSHLLTPDQAEEYHRTLESIE